MGKSGSKTAEGYRKGGVLTLGSLRCGNGLVKATKLDKALRHPGKRYV
jgi:hypothetical protein